MPPWKLHSAISEDGIALYGTLGYEEHMKSTWN